MYLTDEVYLDIGKISVAHEFTLRAVHKYGYPSGRGQYGLSYAISGEVEYKFADGESCTVHTGDILFLSSKSSYTAVGDRYLHYIVNFQIHDEFSSDILSGKNFLLLKPQNPWKYSSIFKELTEVWTAKKSGYEMRATAYVYELLHLLITDMYTEKRDSAAYTRLLPAKEFIDSNYMNSFDIRELARLTSMSVTNFRREWMRHFGETSMQYRDRLRLSCAKEYLSSGYYTVCETAEKCGFEDVSYFVRFFKKHMGISPGEFKKTSAPI